MKMNLTRSALRSVSRCFSSSESRASALGQVHASDPSTSVAPLEPKLPTLNHLIPPFTLTPLKQHSPTTVGIQALLSAQAHLGHEPSRWNRHMLPYIYGTRQGIHIINLEHTLPLLRRACGVVRSVAMSNGNILFVGTRPMIHKLTMETAKSCNSFYILDWIQGTVSNRARVLRRSVGYDPSTVVQSLQGPMQVDAMLAGESNESEDSDESTTLTGKYVHKPDLLVIFDLPNNIQAVREANMNRIPIIAICDTDCDPTIVQYPIPANDDSLSSVSLIASVLGEAARTSVR